MGENDDTQCGSGWHNLENFPPESRWTSQEATGYLKISDETTLCIEALSYYPSITQNPINGYVQGDGIRLGSFRILNSEWQVLRFKLPEFSKHKILELSIGVDEVWIPSEFSESTDQRELGIAITKIWVE